MVPFTGMTAMPRSLSVAEAAVPADPYFLVILDKDRERYPDHWQVRRQGKFEPSTYGSEAEARRAALRCRRVGRSLDEIHDDDLRSRRRVGRKREYRIFNVAGTFPGRVYRIVEK